jgi:hypothetical protein
VPTLYRVFPALPESAADEPGGALYVPPQQSGRIDNPGLYRVFYASDAEAGAIAEAFGRFPAWTRAILEGSPSLPGSVRALARYSLPETAKICDLDDPEQLRLLGLRPSDVVSRDYSRTRAWARRIYEAGHWAGVRWWSYYDPRWISFGIWDARGVALKETRNLTLDDPALAAAALAIARPIIRRKDGHRKSPVAFRK